jgi:acyl-coenzyme A thioesterase PaaI-like protein
VKFKIPMEVQEIETFFDQKKINEYKKLVLNPFAFRAGLIKDLPLASLIGVTLTKIDDNNCELTVPYRFLNKNPFKTTYWAVLGMVAEMGSGALLLMYTHKIQPSVSTFVVGCECKFIKTAKGLTTFKCDQGLEIAEKVMKTCQTFEAQEIVCRTNAYSEQGELLAEFTFTWGIKARRPKS